MRTQDFGYVEDLIQNWGGEIVVDAYNIDSEPGFVILSFLEDGSVVKAVNFHGSKSDILTLFTDILRKNLDKVVEDQREEIAKIKVD